MKKELKASAIADLFDCEKGFFNLIRILTLFIIVSFPALSAGNTVLEETKITLQLKKVPISKVLDEIEMKTHYSILVRDNDINIAETVSIDVTDQTLSRLLDVLFRDKGITYEIKDKTISVFKPDPKYKELPQQSRTVSGVIKDVYDIPLIGATIRIKGSVGIGTVTNIDGQYELANVPDGAILVFSYLGMKTKEVALGKSTQINVTLEEDHLGLEEVVVVAYGSQKKLNLTGAITSVKMKELESLSISNLSNSLAGRAAGVTIENTSGMAGATSSIRIRGSFNEPLFVINNVIKSKQDFDALDPNEVENISFLKDAASASIYGSKAGNGVVLVTTKNGRIQHPEFQYKGSFTTSRTTNQLQSYSATDELIWANRVAQTLNQPQLYGQEIFDYFKDKSYDVNDYIWQNPSSWQHNISVNGGNEAITYYMMLGYHDEDGSYKKVNYKKYNFRSDIVANITKRFKVNFNISGNQRDYNRFFFPYDAVDNFNVPQFYRSTFNWSKLYPFYVDDAGNPTTDTDMNPVVPTAWHPVEMVIGNHYQKLIKRTLDGQLRFDLDLGGFIDGLSTSFFAQYTVYDDNQKALNTYNKSYRFKSASATNKFLSAPIDPNDMVIHNLSTTYEGISEWVSIDNSYQINAFLKYKKSFGKHAIDMLAVYEQAESRGKDLNGRADQLLTTSVDQIFATSSDTQRRYFNGSEWASARMSYVGRLNYDYASKYIAEFSFRYDGNYKFAPKERWGFFPSGSLAWRISEESFFRVPWIDNLKIRGSAGSTGDDNNWDGQDISAFQWRESYANATGYIFGDALSNGLQTGSTANPFISWAKLEMYDAGFDFAILNSRLSGEFDYYYKNKNHILKERNKTVPGTYGASISNENYAEQEWHGFEATIKWSDSFRKLFYTVYANLGYSEDKWLILDEPEGLEEWRSAIGKPNTRLQGYLTDGIIRTQETLDKLPDNFTQFGRKPILGTLLYKDIRGANYSEGSDGKIDNNDMTFISDLGVPRINFGFGFNLQWEGFTLDAHFQGVGAYDRMIRTDNGNGVFQVEDRPYFEIWTGDNVWTPENPDAKYPRVGGTWQEEYGWAGSTYWLRNGAYVRLKNLNIGYTLPRMWFSELGVNQVQLFLNGTNLFYISAMDEMDPEQHALDSYPLMKSFTAGLSINF